MAKIQLSALLSGLSGKHSGGVFTKSTSSLNLRRKVRPHQSASNNSTRVKSRLSYVQSLWATLTGAQVIRWNDLGKKVKGSNVFGDKFGFAGISLFQRLNNNLVACGAAAILDAPTLVDVALWTSFSATAAHGGAVSIIFAPSPVPGATAVEISATPAIAVGRKVTHGDFRIITILAAAQTTPLVATSNYNGIFGAVGNAGQVIYFRAKYINLTTGQSGLPVQCSATIS